MTAGRHRTTRHALPAGRRLAIGVVAILTTTLVGVVPAMAAGSGTVDAQVTITRAAACLEISTTAIDFGTLSLGDENEAGSPTIQLTNCGDGYETLNAAGTDATGGTTHWSIVDSSATCADTLGLDNYRLGLASPGGALIAGLGTANKEVGTLAMDASATHEARIWTACPGSSGSGTVLNMQINYLVTNLDTPPVVLEELTVDQATADGAANFALGGDRTVSVAASCGASPAIGCPGGVPSDPLPQVHVVGSNVVATPAGPDHWNATATVAANSVGSIPVSYLGADCGLTLNTASGASPTVQVTGTLDFLSHPNPAGPKNYIQLGNATVTGLESADIQITGANLTCQLGATLVNLVLPAIQDAVAEQLQERVCGDPNSDTFIVCPPF
jgi:hypothetical protein